jgi:NADP-dependent aldehyde dehydrogenase
MAAADPPAPPTGQLVDGRELPGGGARTRAVDPRTGRPTGPEYADATPDQVAGAARCAGAARDALAAAGPDVVAGLLDGIAAALDGARDGIVALADTETGLGRTRLEGETARTTGQLRMFADLVRSGAHLDVLVEPADPTAVPPRPDLRRTRVPVGPVAVFGASNFPLAFGVAGGDTASALAARCPVVVKAHPAHPGTSAAVGDLIVRQVAAAGLPAGVFGLVHGAEAAVGQALVAAPEIAAVGFTGSTTAGLALTATARARPVPIPVHAEMSSLNPVVVTPAALADALVPTARELAASVTTGWGQLCTKPGVVVVPDRSADAFVDELAAALAQASPGPLLTAAIRDRLRDRAAELGAPGPVPGPGHHHPPLVARATAQEFLADPRLREEVFGPAVVVVTVADLDEARAVVAALPGSLTGTVRSGPGVDGRGDEWAAPLVRALLPRVGRLLGAGVPTGVAVTAAQHHGGPFPATGSPEHTSVGTRAVDRFTRPVVFQDVPQALLPPELRDRSPISTSRGAA